MDQKEQKVQTDQFSDIINPQGVNLQLFFRACENDEVQSLSQFILTVQKILKLYDKPGRTNPLTALPSKNINLLIEKLNVLRKKLKHTIYELKVKQIIETIQIMGSSKIIPKPAEQDEQNKKLINSIKIDQVLSNPKILNNKFSHPKFLYEFAINEVLPQAGRQILSINDHEKRYEAVIKGLQICNALVHPTQIQIQISKNTLLETRVFKMKYQREFQASQDIFLKRAANIINQAILCPSDARVQALLLKILKRMYRLWGQIMHGPLFLNLRNISLFFSEDASTSKMIKQAAIFCYSIINSKLDIKFGDILSSSQQLKDLKRNQFFSSKGLALPFQLGLTLDTLSLQLPIWQYRLHLEKRQSYAYPIIIEKSNTLLFWSFNIQDYDVNFAVYKVDSLRKYQVQQYDKNLDCKTVVKPAKYGNGTGNSKMPAKGHTFLKSGVYHLVFDNAHSIVRGKDIMIEVCQLEPSI